MESIRASDILPEGFVLLAGAQQSTGTMQPDERQPLSQFELFKRRKPEGSSERISTNRVPRKVFTELIYLLYRTCEHLKICRMNW